MRQPGCTNNQITDLIPLKGLTNLQTLTLSGNKIQDVSPVSDLTKLKHLELQYDRVRSKKLKRMNPSQLTLSLPQITFSQPLIQPTILVFR